MIKPIETSEKNRRKNYLYNWKKNCKNFKFFGKNFKNLKYLEKKSENSLFWLIF